MEEKFGIEWYKLLKLFLDSKKFNKIREFIKEERKIKEVVPSIESNLMFKMFKDLQPSNIKVVILGNYPVDKNYTGYAFENTQELENILDEVDINSTDKDIDNSRNKDLSRWIKQGVFLPCSSLTATNDASNYHAKVWNKFTEYWIEQLDSNYDNIVWLLFGNLGCHYRQFIVNPLAYVINTSEHTNLGQDKTDRPFKNSKCFEEINNHLWVLNKDCIKW